MAENTLDDIERHFLLYQPGRHGMTQGIFKSLADMIGEGILRRNCSEYVRMK